MSTEEDRVATLEVQQGLFSDSLVRMLSSAWTGFPSVQADIEALSPGIELVPEPPVAESQAPQPPWQPDWLAYFKDHRDWPMAPQTYNWTCSVASTTWLLQATGLDPDVTRLEVGESIGYPGCVNSYNGLESVDCILRVLRSYGVRAREEWVGFDHAFAIADGTGGILNGKSWYHFVGLRGQSAGDLWVANSARGYRGVYDTLSRAQFGALGPFRVIYLDPYG